MKACLTSPPYWNLFQDHLGSPGAYEPLGIEYVAAYAQRSGVECEIYQGVQTEPEKVASEIARGEFDVVGISAATPAVPWAHRLAAALKAGNKKPVVVIGGDYASSCPKEILSDDVFDYAVSGEGEEVFSALLLALQNKADVKQLAGLTFRDEVGQLCDGPPKRLMDLNALPWPVRSKSILQRCRLNGLSYPAPSKQSGAAQILYSRGCPRQCDYCSSGSVFKKGVVYRDPVDVALEMRDLRDRFDANLFYLSDLSFGARRESVRLLCQAIRAKCSNVSWYVSASSRDIREDDVFIMAEAGCFKVAIGIESMHDKIHRSLRNWSTPADVASAAAAVDRAGMLVRGYYMVGAPGDTPQLFREGVEVLCRTSVDEIRLSFFTPFPGTPPYERYRDHVITHDLSAFGSADPILNLPTFPVAEQRKAYDWAIRRFYEGPEYAARWRHKVRRFPHYEQSYGEFLSFLKDRGIHVR